MPLRALLNGTDVIAPILDDEQWAALQVDLKARRRTLVLPCCQAEGATRTSKLGTRHFYHKRRSHEDRPACEWKSESVEHLYIKQAVIDAARSIGYQATPEVSGEDWRADVLVTNGKWRVAFEVQWSRQTLTETIERQTRYQRDGIKACWLFRKLPNEVKQYEWVPRMDLPIFELKAEPHLCVRLNELTIDIRTFVEALLTRRIRWSDVIVEQQQQLVKVVFFYIRCWKCKKISHIYYVDTEYSYCCDTGDGRCGEWIDLDVEFVRKEFRPEVIAAVKQFLATREGRGLKVGAIKRRYSYTEKTAYLSFGCFHCDALFGDFFLQGDMFRARSHGYCVASFSRTVHVSKPRAISAPHWCTSSIQALQNGKIEKSEWQVDR